MTQSHHTGYEQVEMMRQGVNYRFPVIVRGFSVSLRPLSVQEVLEVTSAVQSHFSGLPVHARNSMTEHVLFAQKCLEKASTPDVETNSPTLPEAVIQRFTTFELDYVYKEWVGGCDRCNPALEALPAQDVEALVEEVKKKPSDLIELSFLQLANVCRSLLAASHTDS